MESVGVDLPNRFAPDITNTVRAQCPPRWPVCPRHFNKCPAGEQTFLAPRECILSASRFIKVLCHGLRAHPPGFKGLSLHLHVNCSLVLINRSTHYHRETHPITQGAPPPRTVNFRSSPPPLSLSRNPPPFIFRDPVSGNAYWWSHAFASPDTQRQMIQRAFSLPVYLSRGIFFSFSSYFRLVFLVSDLKFILSPGLNSSSYFEGRFGV